MRRKQKHIYWHTEERLLRYHDSALLTSFLSVDPLSDKYPNLSPYAYCAWTRPTGGHEHLLIKFNLVNNPMKLVDPDGRKWDSASTEIVSEYQKGLVTKLTEISDRDKRKEINDALTELDALSNSNQIYHVEMGTLKTPRAKGETGWDYKNKQVSITLNYDYKPSDIAHEMKHAYQFEIGELSFSSFRGGGECFLYDFTDERAAYNCGAVFGGDNLSDQDIMYHSHQMNYDSDGRSYNIYHFLTQDKVYEWKGVNTIDIGQGRMQSRNSTNSTNLSSQIYRKDGKTFGIR